MRGRLVSNHEDAIPYDPYQHLELMRSKRHLRLKRAAEDRLDLQSNEGSRVSRLVIHLGPKIWGPEVQQ